MKVVLLYGTTCNTTRTITKKLAQLIHFKYDSFNVKEIDDNIFLLDYDLYFFICPTYGDGELQGDMEKFLQNLKLDLNGKKYIVCETGNYFGYDDFEFGAIKIIEHEIKKLGAKKFFEGFSLDTLPKIDWDLLQNWSIKLNEKMSDERY